MEPFDPTGLLELRQAVQDFVLRRAGCLGCSSLVCPLPEGTSLGPKLLDTSLSNLNEK
jgi:hypothetical protein